MFREQTSEIGMEYKHYSFNIVEFSFVVHSIVKYVSDFVYCGDRSMISQISTASSRSGLFSSVDRATVIKSVTLALITVLLSPCVGAIPSLGPTLC